MLIQGCFSQITNGALQSSFQHRWGCEFKPQTSNLEMETTTKDGLTILILNQYNLNYTVQKSLKISHVSAMIVFI